MFGIFVFLIISILGFKEGMQYFSIQVRLRANTKERREKRKKRVGMCVIACFIS